jgi:hypothetical protein
VHPAIVLPSGQIINAVSAECVEYIELPSTPGAVRVVVDQIVLDVTACYYDATLGRVVFLKCASPLHCLNFDTRTWDIDLAAPWEQVRYRRDALLAVTDWRILPDATTSETDRTRWVAYRQALRDITKQRDPLNIIWPEPVS